MCHLRVATSLLALTREIANWWLSTAGQWCLKDGPTTIASNIIEDGFFAGGAGTFMTEVGAVVVPAFEWTITTTCADMLSLKLFPPNRSSIEKRLFLAPLRSQALGSKGFSGTTPFTTFVSTTV